MSDFDETAFRAKVEQLSDDELIALVSINARSHVPEAIEMANRQIDVRRLRNDGQNVIFDVFLNTSGFAGRLILLDEQIMFLSTGLRAAGGGGGAPGLVGAIAGEAHAAARNLAAKKSDFSALDNEGSWIYYLDQIHDCQAKSSLLGGKQLLFEVEEEDGKIINGVVRCDDISQTDFQNLPTQILDTRSGMTESAA